MIPNRLVKESIHNPVNPYRFIRTINVTLNTSSDIFKCNTVMLIYVIVIVVLLLSRTYPGG
jgi:hypothetical protein